MRKIKTALEFTKNLKTTGAVYETSKKGEQALSRFVVDSEEQIVVEFGAGHGNITSVILSRMNPNSKLYAFELNSEFCDVLSNIDDDRLVVINDSAQHLDKHVPEDIDCIISSIPYTFIPDQVVNEILEKSQEKLKDGGEITQLLYSAYFLKKYKRYFKNVSYKFILNIPPEFIYHGTKQ